MFLSNSFFIDFKITAYILNPDHIKELGDLFKEGVTSYKFLTAYRGEEARQVGISEVTWKLVYEGFEAISKYPRPAMAMLHAENVDLIEVFILALILSIIAGLYPAWRASKLSPISALRKE